MPLQCSSENQNPNTGRQTPISHRRPLRNSNLNAAILSPTKRRKQSHPDEPPAVVEPVKPLFFQDENSAQPPTPKAEQQADLVALLEVFSRLGARDIVSAAAFTCKRWRQVAHGKELWAVLQRQLRLIDQLLISEKVVERRSKGRLFRCRRLGTGEMDAAGNIAKEQAVLLRVVDLELTNAGKDDGVPTSFLREAALLAKLRHPNIIRHLGSEIMGKRAVMCTEFVHDNFASWFKQLDSKGNAERLLDVKQKFRQVLTGLSFVHHQGVMHRNLKPDNIFLDLAGTVKLGDFTTTRMLDIPFQAYTPEDPKERERSGREMRRLWYRAPELILRDEVYGPKVDTWSVGCLLAEAATGRALFPSDSEIDHLFRVFRLLGTPTTSTWPQIITMKNFSPKFPIYSGFSFEQVTRAASSGSAIDQDVLQRQAAPDRNETLNNIMSVAALLGADGMQILDQLVAVPPSRRAGADDALQSTFFQSQQTQPLPGHQRADQLLATPWLRSDVPPVAVAHSLIPPNMVWSILKVMQDHEVQEARRHGNSAELFRPEDAMYTSPQLPDSFDEQRRAVLVDFIIGLASTLSLTDYTMHLAAAVVDRYVSLHESPDIVEKWQAVGATCLKVADVFAEQSKEYYKQENAVEYAEATHHQVSSEQMLTCEKDVLTRLGFNLLMPTTHWFMQCYLAYGKFTANSAVAKVACFISDLSLLDSALLAYPPSLRAQCALVLGVFLVQQAQWERRRPTPGRDEEARSQDPPAFPRTSPSEGCLPCLSTWDQSVRDQACRKNTTVEAAMCLQAVVRTLVEKRREWKGAKLTAVEAKHASVVRTLVYPESFPVSKLVRYITPDHQRGAGDALSQCSLDGALATTVKN